MSTNSWLIRCSIHWFNLTLMQICDQPIKWQHLSASRHDQDNLLEFKLSIRTEKEDGLQQQRTTPNATPVSWKQETDTTIMPGLVETELSVNNINAFILLDLYQLFRRLLVVKWRICIPLSIPLKPQNTHFLMDASSRITHHVTKLRSPWTGFLNVKMS